MCFENSTFYIQITISDGKSIFNLEDRIIICYNYAMRRSDEAKGNRETISWFKL